MVKTKAKGRFFKKLRFGDDYCTACDINHKDWVESQLVALKNECEHCKELYPIVGVRSAEYD